MTPKQVKSSKIGNDIVNQLHKAVLRNTVKSVLYLNPELFLNEESWDKIIFDNESYPKESMVKYYAQNFRISFYMNRATRKIDSCVVYTFVVSQQFFGVKYVWDEHYRHNHVMAVAKTYQGKDSAIIIDNAFSELTHLRDFIAEKYDSIKVAS